MSKFVLRDKVSLDKLGHGWAGCYLELNSLSINDIETNMAKVASSESNSPEQVALLRELVENVFVSGLGFTGSEQAEIKKEDIGELPMAVVNEAFSFLAGKTELQTDSSEK